MAALAGREADRFSVLAAVIDGDTVGRRVACEVLEVDAVDLPPHTVAEPDPLIVHLLYSHARADERAMTKLELDALVQVRARPVADDATVPGDPASLSQGDLRDLRRVGRQVVIRKIGVGRDDT